MVQPGSPWKTTTQLKILWSKPVEIIIKLQEEMEKIPGWPDYKVNVWHAVLFFLISQYHKGKFLRADLPREQIIDKEDLGQH